MIYVHYTLCIFEGRANSFFKFVPLAFVNLSGTICEIISKLV